MKPEEELFADFVNEYHSDEAMEIATDPLLYIYYRDSTEFACYKFRHAFFDLIHTIDAIFKISVLLNGCVKFINKVIKEKDNNAK